MQYKVQKGEKGNVEVKVDLPQAGFDQAYKETLATIVKNSNISGFRPGMAPVEVVEKHVGVSKVLNDTASFLINQHLAEIFEKEKFFPIDSPKIAIDTLAFGSPFAYTVSFVQKPQVKIGDWKKISVKKITAKEVTEADVAASIKNIYDAYLKQREAGNKKPETENEEEKGDKYIFDAQGNKIFVGDEKGADNKKIEAHKIDDEFAKAIGAKDLAHLREIVKNDLETLVLDQVEQNAEQEIFDEIMKVSEVEVPEILVEDELNRILLRLSNELERQGKELDVYLKEQKTTIDELKAKWREQAEKNVKTTLIMDEIGRNEGVKVEKPEVDEAMKGVNQTSLSADQVADLQRYLTLSIFQAKTLALVKKTISSS